MKLITNWLTVLRCAWSIRLMILAGILSGIEVALPLIDGWVEVPRGIFASFSGLVTALAFVARLVAQNNVSRDRGDG